MNKLTRKDLMQRWGVSSRTLDRWVKEKGVPHRKSQLNGRIIFKEEDIVVWEKEMGIGEND